MRTRDLLFIIIGLVPIVAQAQEVVVTESGKRVVILPNGKWELEKPVNPAAVKSLNIKKPLSSTDKISFNKGRGSLYFNPSIWKLKPQNSPTKFDFQHKEGDGHAIVIAERMEATPDAVKNIAIMHAKNVAPDTKVISEEHFNVNGTDIIALKYQATVQGISFVFYGYLFGGKEGCIQVLTYTTTNLFDEYENDFIEFLNGFTLETSTAKPEPTVAAANPATKTADEWINIGNQYFDTQQHEKAIEAYRKALELRPGDPNVLSDQGVMYRDLGQTEKALECFHLSIKNQPNHIASHFNLGVMYSNELKNSDKAKKYFKKVIQIAPNNPLAVQAKINIEKL